MQEAHCLLRRSEPYGKESLAGFLLRLAESNCYDSVRWIFQLANLSKYEPNANLLVPGKHSLLQLSQLTGVHETILWQMAFPAADHKDRGNYVEAFGRTIPSYFIHKTVSKICPKCLEEIPFRRKIWDVSTITACPKHKCLLVDTCSQCQKLITWGKASLTKCRCGFDLRNLNISIVTEEETFLSLQVYKLCSQLGLENYSVSSINLINSIYSLKLEELLTLITFLAGQFIGICDATGKIVATKYRNNELHLLLIKSFNLFIDWSDRFYEFLDWRKSLQVEHDRDTGIARDFGSFYKKLYTNFSAEPYSFLREAFEGYLAERWDGGYLNTKLGRIENSTPTVKTFIPGTEAAQILSLSEAWVLKLIEQGVLEGSIKRMGTRTLILAKLGSVLTYQQLLNNSLTLKEVAAVLAIGHRTVVDLVSHSCIKALRGPKSDGHRQWKIDSESVKLLLTQLDELSQTLPDANQSVISASLSIRKLSGLGYTFGQLIQLALDRKIEVFRDSVKQGLEKYSFPEEQVDKLVKQATSASKGSYLTVLDVANSLKVKQEVVRFWINKSLLICDVTVEGKHVRRKISKQELEIFQQRYISAVTVAEHLQTSPKKVVQLLSEGKILPITGPSIDGGRQYLFHKADVEVFIQHFE